MKKGFSCRFKMFCAYNSIALNSCNFSFCSVNDWKTFTCSIFVPLIIRVSRPTFRIYWILDKIVGNISCAKDRVKLIRTMLSHLTIWCQVTLLNNKFILRWCWNWLRWILIWSLISNHKFWCFNIKKYSNQTLKSVELSSSPLKPKVIFFRQLKG